MSTKLQGITQQEVGIVRVTTRRCEIIRTDYAQPVLGAENSLLTLDGVEESGSAEDTAEPGPTDEER